MNLRYYQNDAIAALYAYFATHAKGNPLIAAPTGTGKSLIIGGFIKSVFDYYPGQRVLCVTHVKELIEQNLGKLLALWPTAPAGVYSAGLKRKEIAPITFAGVKSIYKNAAALGHIDLMIVDEAHLVSPNDDTAYRQLIDVLLRANPRMRVIGLSATCYRLGLGSLTEGGIFTDIPYDLTSREQFNKLIAEGYIAPLVPKRTSYELDTSGVHMRGGEFIESELQAAVDRETVTYYALRETVDAAIAENRKSWLVFTTGIEHTEHVASMLQAQFGINARGIHSKTPPEQRDEYIRAFKAGRLTALVNNNILTTGFDHPGVDLECILRPTNSTVLWVQMLGRGTRPAPNKTNCLVLDFAGNTRRLGPINDPVLPRAKGKGGSLGDAPVRVCEICNTYNHASARFCEHCGAEFPRAVKFGKNADTRELIAGDAPVVEVFKVDRVVYNIGRKSGRPPTLKVTYYCGLHAFSEWVCLEHDGYALHTAHDWWRARSHIEPPGMVQLALEHSHTLRVPTHLRVWVNVKYPEILAHAFDGEFPS